MSNIGPVQRNPVQSAELYAGLNEPAPAVKEADVTQVDPVKSIDKTELLGDHREIKPAIDQDTDRVILQVVDKDTKDVVFQVPSELALRLARDLRRKQNRRGSSAT